jgi:hypothetical protein
VQTDLARPLTSSGSRSFTLSEQADNVVAIDLAKGEEVILQTQGAAGSMTIEPVAAEAGKYNCWGGGYCQARLTIASEQGSVAGDHRLQARRSVAANPSVTLNRSVLAVSRVATDAKATATVTLYGVNGAQIQRSVKSGADLHEGCFSLRIPYRLTAGHYLCRITVAGHTTHHRLALVGR